MALKLYIVRHGETLWNKEHKLQGQLDSDLSEKGIMQAKKLSLKLKDINFAKVYSSISNRALKTAKILVGDKDIEKTDLIQEIHMGIWQGMDKSDVLEKYRENNYKFWNAPHDYDHISNKGESFEDLIKRSGKFLEKVSKENQDGNILIISHGVAIKAILSYIENKTVKEFWDGQFILNTSVSIVEYDMEKGYKIKKISDISHLEN